MWTEILKQIEENLKKYGESLNSAASEIEIKYLIENVKKMFEVDLPEQYVKFLRTVDGLDFDGLTIYGVDQSLLETKPSEPVYGFIETNEVWYENEEQKKYLFFGDSDISWYCLNLSTGKYEVRDKPSGTVMEIYEDFDSMVKGALRDKG